MRKNKRNKQNIISNKSIMCLTTIVGLNLIGISYATWTEDLDIIASITTGVMEPSFVQEELPEYLDVDIIGDKLIINGSISSTYDDELYIDIKNDGTIPFEFDDLEILRDDDIVKSVKVSDDEVYLHIQADTIADNIPDTIAADETKETQHKFKYRLVFEQK